VGCGVIIESQGAQITGVRGDPAHPANFGRLCTKGSTLHLTASVNVTRQTRLLQPMRRAARGAAPHATSWDSALDEAATRLAHIASTRGPDAIGIYISGQLLTEDYYAFNKLAKGLLRTNNVDTNSRLCMSSAVAGYKATLGADAPPCSYEDLDHAATVFIAGSNMAWAHPILFRRLEDARRANPQQKWIVVDPRRTETAAAADLHLQILPGTDVALFNGMLHLLLWEGLVDRAYIEAHTTGFDALRDIVRNGTPAETARLCGIQEADLVQAARWFGGAVAAPGEGAEGASRRRRPTLSLYCQGLNQSVAGTDKNAALINLHLATGQIGQPGAGPFSLTGQPNAMGGREVGGLANLLSAHRDLANLQHRAEVAALWGLKGGESDVPAEPGKSAVEMFQAAADGEIAALWIACTNPAQSLPDQATVRRALERAEFVIVQEAFATTATTAYGDLLLPATTWGEKDGTVTNSERRISRLRPAVAAPGQARHDWRIAVDVARRIEALLPPRRTDGATLFPFDTAESLWNEHRESTRGRDLDITGLSYARLEGSAPGQGPQQWPLREGEAVGAVRLYADGRFPTPDGRARFAAVAARPLAEKRDAPYPFSLNTGRLRDQWHGMSRTGTLGRLFGHAAEPVVDMHPSDLARLRMASGDLVQLKSRRGTLVLPAQASTTVAPAQAFVAMHWGDEVLGGRHRGGINALTSPAFCPQSKQPELKHAAVKITPAGLPWQLLARAWLPAGVALQRRAALLAACSELDYAACMPFGREGAVAEGARGQGAADGDGGDAGAADAAGLSGNASEAEQGGEGGASKAERLGKGGESGAGVEADHGDDGDDGGDGGHGRQVGVWLRAAAPVAPDAAWLARIEALLGLDAPEVLRYADPKRGQRRSVRLLAHQVDGQPAGARLQAFLFSGDVQAAGWVSALLLEELPAQAYGRALLAGTATPPLAVPSRGQQVCNCFDVSEHEISATLARCVGSAEARLAQLQGALKCGTNCGSCLPALRQQVQRVPAQTQPAAQPAAQTTVQPA
jgi:assimilatory nitrate reductase catalytic subunit